jgi:hypothetical protein
VSLTTPTGLAVPSSEFLLFRGDFEGPDETGAEGLAQGGYYTSGSAFSLDNCGTSLSTVFFTETHPNNGDVTTYRCTLPGVPTPGATYTVATWDTQTVGEFVSIFQDNGPSVTSQGPFTLGYRQGVSAVGGEINGSDGQTQAHGTVRYGAGNPWTVYRGSGLTQPGVVQDCGNTFTVVPNLGGWTTPCPPTPFTISH